MILHFCEAIKFDNVNEIERKRKRQAGAELCQAQGKLTLVRLSVRAKSRQRDAITQT